MGTHKRKGHSEKSRGLTMAETLLAAIEASGLTLYRLAKDSGVPHTTLYRFVHGEGHALTVDTFEKLCHIMGLSLQPDIKLRKKPTRIAQEALSHPEAGK
jgi:transcriptional regulator with XRE-family HTH domain